MLKGRYRVDQVLHIGPHSSVYAGVDQKSGRVAIKVLDSTPDASLLRSSYLANAVGHPSAVNVLDTGTAGDGAIFLVMELLEAFSMRALLEQHEGRLPVRLACTIADQGLDLLASAHDQGIAHGQIALDKLFFTRTERLKVLGFGKQASEQAAAEDVRALSKVVAWLLCGEPVESVQAAAVPARITAVIERGLHADPAQQWKSAQAMRTALQLACKAELGRPIDRGLQPLAARQAPRRSRGLWLVGATLLVLGLYASREVSELADTTAPEPESDVAAALQAPPAQAQAQGQEQPAAEPEPADQQALEDKDEEELESQESHAPEPEPSRARVVPRKPNRPELRAKLQRNPGIPTNIAPISQLCAQLTSARRARPLSDHESQLYDSSCTKR
jgi:hypothetical protein